MASMLLTAFAVGLGPTTLVELGERNDPGPKYDLVWEKDKTMYGKVHIGNNDDNNRLHFFKVSRGLYPHHKRPESLLQFEGE